MAKEVKCERCNQVVANIKDASLRRDVVMLCAPCYNDLIGTINEFKAISTAKDKDILSPFKDWFTPKNKNNAEYNDNL